MTLHRPEPIRKHAARPVDQTTSPEAAARQLLDGQSLVVVDRYGTGAEILVRLSTMLHPLPDHAPYAKRQAFQRTYREAALRLLAPIRNHQVALELAGSIGFLKQLYPELPSFFLPFIQVQELHGAWERYTEGTHLAVLGHRVHPFYGTYAPTRVSHLELFGTWLSRYTGSRQQAVDVGTGCGVLALMLARAGFEHVRATDINPNAVESVARELRRLPDRPPITLEQGDLLGEDPTPVDLVVFNPPWIHGEADGLVDRALYYSDGLFERFFDQVAERLAPGGRVVILFSNVDQLMQPERPHPILAELERGRFDRVDMLRRKVKPTPTRSGRPRRTKERVEVWELALAGDSTGTPEERST